MGNECGYISGGYYTCNGSPKGCERQRFGQCGYHDNTDQRRTIVGDMQAAIKSIDTALDERNQLREEVKELRALLRNICDDLRRTDTVSAELWALARKASNAK